MLRNFGRQLKTGRGCLGVGGGIMLTAVFHGTKLVMASITLTAALTMAGGSPKKADMMRNRILCLPSDTRHCDGWTRAGQLVRVWSDPGERPHHAAAAEQLRSVGTQT